MLAGRVRTPPPGSRRNRPDTLRRPSTSAAKAAQRGQLTECRSTRSPPRWPAFLTRRLTKSLLFFTKVDCLPNQGSAPPATFALNRMSAREGNPSPPRRSGGPCKAALSCCAPSTSPDGPAHRPSKCHLVIHMKCLSATGPNPGSLPIRTLGGECPTGHEPRRIGQGAARPSSSQ